MGVFQSKYTGAQIEERLDAVPDKQDALVSGENIKTVNNQSLLGPGNVEISSAPEIFWATYGTTTAAEIDAAVAAGKEVLCLKDDRVYQLVINASNLTYIQFFAMLDTSVTYLRLKRSNNAWDSTTNSFQKTSDRVSTISGNESDTTKYPNTKAMADYTGLLSNLVTTNKTNLVAAINEAAQSGGGGSYVLHGEVYDGNMTITSGSYYDAMYALGHGKDVFIIFTIDYGDDYFLARETSFSSYSIIFESISAGDNYTVELDIEDNATFSEIGQFQTKDNLATSLSGSDANKYPNVPAVNAGLATKQVTLVSGTNIKTINSQSLLGSGDIAIEDGVGFDTITTPSPADGTAIITLTNGDTITLDLNHKHPTYPNYVLCANQAAYDAITTKEPDTLYLIPETS